MLSHLQPPGSFNHMWHTCICAHSTVIFLSGPSRGTWTVSRSPCKHQAVIRVPRHGSCSQLPHLGSGVCMLTLVFYSSSGGALHTSGF